MAILTSTYRTAIPRHQTMHNALAGSYGLLTEPELRLLVRLSVFAGGWTKEAGQAIQGDASEANFALALRQLSSKSLVLMEQHGSGKRFRLLEPIRQYAHAQLMAGNERSETRRRHAHYFLSLAEAMDQARDHPAEREWLLKLEPERENLRVANDWALEHNEAEFAQRFNGALFAFWIYRSGAAPARRCLEAALALKAETPTPNALRAEASALDTAGYIAVSQGEYELGQRHFERELALCRQLGDPRGVATGLRGCGLTAMQRGNLERAQRCVEQSLEVSQAAADISGCAWSQFDLGYLALLRGEFRHAQEFLHAAMFAFREQSNLFGLHRAHFALARVRAELGDNAQARAHYRDGFELQQKMRYLHMTAVGLEGLAGIVVRENMPDRAARLFGAAHRHRATAAMQRWEHTNAWYERDLALALSQMDSATWNAHWEAGRGLDQEAAVAYALTA